MAEPGTPEQIAQRLVAAVRSRFPWADGACVFWTAAGQAGAVDSSGRLYRPLSVHLHGPAVLEAATAAFEQAGLTVRVDGPAPLMALS